MHRPTRSRSHRCWNLLSHCHWIHCQSLKSICTWRWRSSTHLGHQLGRRTGSGYSLRRYHSLDQLVSHNLHHRRSHRDRRWPQLGSTLGFCICTWRRQSPTHLGHPLDMRRRTRCSLAPRRSPGRSGCHSHCRRCRLGLLSWPKARPLSCMQVFVSSFFKFLFCWFLFLINFGLE